jgi:S1-C subfamily serine protease
MNVAEDHFCDKSLKPWLIALVLLTVLFVVWGMVDREELLPHRRAAGTPAPASVQHGEPVIYPGPVRPVAFAAPADPAANVNPDPNLNPNPVNAYANNPYNLAAITKATPNGGVQLVANTTNTGFQSTLKKSVNAVLPTVCDIHAMWTRPRGVRKQFVNGQPNVQFAPPFDGTIDKFVQNQGYENIGAGFIVDERGYVLTNYHVVRDATNILVTVPGNPERNFTARAVASDPTKDLALLKLDTKTELFQEAKLGDSSFAQVGDYVISIGSPFGMEQTVTSGIISGIRKAVMIDGIEFMNLIQTDAPINRGSSGGPLVNMKGEIIGITTAIYAPTGVFNGTGFVIPINDVKDFIGAQLGQKFSLPVNQRGMFEQPVQAKPVAAGGPVPVRFGVEAIPLDPLLAKQMGAENMGGILVNRVLDNSPAGNAGITRGDIITSIGGVPVKTLSDVALTVSHFKAGDNANVTVVRNGKTNELLVKLW